MRATRRGLEVALLPFLLALPGLAQDPAPDRPARPRIGVVLSGGGARGAAHVGVLQVFEELRIPIHAIAANSMGALVGGNYCYGHSPEELADVLTKVIDWPLELSDKPPRRDMTFRRKEDDRNFLIDWALGFRDWGFVLPLGVVQGHYVENTLKVLTPDAYELRDFDDLPIPFRAVATNIGTGKEVVLSSGDLPLAMKASMSIPGFFAPTEIDGQMLVDGMVVNNIPIDVVKSMDVDVIIAVDIGTPILKAEDIKSLLNITGQMVSILMQQNVDRGLELLTDADVLVRPDLGDITSTSFDRCAEAIVIGETAARAMAPTLSKFSVSEEEYAEYLRHQRRPPATYPIIDSIEIVNNSNLANEVIAAYIDVKPGERLNPKTLLHDLNRIHGREDFERVTFALEKKASGEVVLKIFAFANEWGPNYIRFGLNIEDDFEGDGTYNFRVNYTMRALNGLGAEWRNDAQIGENLGFQSEFFQPLDYANRFFVAPRAQVIDFPVDLYANHHKIAQVDVLVAELGFDVGVNLGNWAEVRAGILRGWGDINFEINTTPAPDSSFNDGAFRTGIVVDTVDDANFPSQGTFIDAEYLWALDGLGADNEYQKVFAKGYQAVTWNNNTLLAGATYASAVGSTLPLYRTVSAGGFLNLSGLQPGELRGQHSVVFRGIVYRQIGGERLQTFGMPVYLGGSIEYGNVSQELDDLLDNMILAGSAWLGVDSPLGPVYLAYGMAEGGQDSLYLFIGQTFTR